MYECNDINRVQVMFIHLYKIGSVLSHQKMFSFVYSTCTYLVKYVEFLKHKLHYVQNCHDLCISISYMVQLDPQT